MSAVLPTGGAMALVWRFALATTGIVLAFSMSSPVLAVRLQQGGAGTTLVGLFAMLPFAMVGLLIPVMPRVLQRWGLVRAYRGGTTLQLLGALSYVASDSGLAWALGSVVGGIGTAAMWNATEALLAREAPADQRGRVMGLYQTALGAALALGPFMPALMGGGHSVAVLWTSAGLIAACTLLAWLTPGSASVEPPPGQAGTWQALRQVPLLGLLAFAGGVFEAGLGSVSAANASALGMDLELAASVAGAIGVGSFLCQLPAGLAADRWRMRTVFSVAAGLLLIASVGIAFAGQAPWLLWAVGAVWGGVGGALYTLTMVEVAHQFDGQATAGGAAAMISGYTLGGVVGPVASGGALQVAGLGGLAVLLGVLAVATLGAARGLRD